MPLQLGEVQDEDFLEVCTALFDAFENPPERYLRVVAPIINDDRQASIEAYATRSWQKYKADPDARWMKVVDTDANNKIVAAAKWDFHRENPFANIAADEPFEAVWWPEGPARVLATQVVLQIIAPHVTRAQRPHAFLNANFTIPTYRRRGIGQMLMTWGVNKADELGLESWVEGTTMGRFLYEKNGFILLDEHSPKVQEPENLSEADKAEWIKACDMLLPIRTATLWRPKGGKYVEGVTVKEWEVA